MPEVAGITTAREQLRALLDRIPDGDVLTARKILRSLVDPVALALLHAPPGHEPLSGHEKAALETARLREQRGESLIPHEEILREFGLGAAAL